MPATLLDRVTRRMRIYREESFGPVKASCACADVEEAIALRQRQRVWPVFGGVSRDDVARTRGGARIESGICHINGPTVHDEAQMPFGGVKGSGYGRFGGKAGVAEFTDLRWITLDTRKQHYPFPAAEGAH